MTKKVKQPLLSIQAYVALLSSQKRSMESTNKPMVVFTVAVVVLVLMMKRVNSPNSAFKERKTLR